MVTLKPLVMCMRGAAAAALLVLAGSALADGQQGALVEPCARTDSFPRPNVVGPFDYRTGGGRLSMVESNHFTPTIENLIRGRTGTLAQELSFLLHGFPNHHRGLVAISRYGLRERSPQPGNLDYSIDCYFMRALRFQPDDYIVNLLFADYLAKTNRPTQAVQFLDAVRNAPVSDNPLTAYNLGMLYLEVGRYDLALEQAHKAMELGNPRTGLADALRAKGKWSEPPAAGAASSAPAAAEPAASAASAAS